MRRDVILVPRRDDNGPRDELWDGFVKPWWEREQSHMPIIEGYHTEGLFNRSAAINRAARLAGDWDVACIIDADVLCNPARVKEAMDLAASTGKMVLPHSERRDLNKPGTQRVVRGYDGNWDRWVYRRYSVANGHPSVSSVVVVPRILWDTIGGFDEGFRGWGYEDTAFAAAAETFGGIIRMDGEVWHLWHPTAREGKRGTEAWSANSSRGQRYRAAIGDADAIRALQAEVPPEASTVGIPRILHRVVPEQTEPQAERWWAEFQSMHPGWEFRTHRDPLDPADWPMTAGKWSAVSSGAQLADLVRLEALYRWGGVYVDQDCQPLRPMDSLLPLSMFAAYEDHRSIPNAVMGATPGHPAIAACLDLTMSRIPGETWAAGPGVLTDLLPGRDDVLLLPPGCFYAVHYRDPERDVKMERRSTIRENPWAFVLHHYWGSWLSPEVRAEQHAVA